MLEACDSRHMGRDLPADDFIQYEKCLIDYDKVSNQVKKS